MKNPTMRTEAAVHIVRVGTGITFVWVGVLIFRSPEAWGGLLLPWAAGLLPIPLHDAMIGTAILDVAIGFFLLIDILTLPAAFLGMLHLVGVLALTGISEITVRDIGLLAATLALVIARWPEKKGGKREL